MEVYFDNSATTRCYDSVKDIVVKTMTEDFGNPSAMHLKRCRCRKICKRIGKDDCRYSESAGKRDSVYLRWYRI